MPALQSPWFAPHVIVYMFAYAVFGVATLMAIFLLVKKKSLTSHLFRQSRLCRPRLYDYRHALRSFVG